MKAVHILRDGTLLDNVDGLTVPIEGHENLYKALGSIRKEGNNANK